jgi:hypothetical protein
MGSVWFSKKAFLYFGGAAIILIGGAIVLMSPYHYVNFAVIENEQRTFAIWDKDGYYPQLEISVTLRPGNSSVVEIGLVLEENRTLDTIIVNMTLDSSDMVETPDAIFFEDSIIVNVPYGNYSITMDKIDGAGLIDIGFNQVSDSRTFIFVGGSMNIIGLFMGIGGYFVAGSFLPTDSDTIVEWGFEEEEDKETYGNSS